MKSTTNLAFFVFVFLLFASCEPNESLPVLTTAEVSELTYSSAKSGGVITTDGGALITERGVCWNTTGNPTIADSITTDGTGAESFVSEITGLKSNTTYYVRAYATNAVGTAYGQEVSFKTEVQIIEINNVKIVNNGPEERLDFLDYYMPGWDPYNPEKKQFYLSCYVNLEYITQIKDYLTDIIEISIDSIKFSFITDGLAEGMNYIIDVPWGGLTEFDINSFSSWEKTETHLNTSLTKEELKYLSKEFLEKKTLSFDIMVYASHFGWTHATHTCSLSVTMFANFKVEVKN